MERSITVQGSNLREYDFASIELRPNFDLMGIVPCAGF